MPTCSTGPCWTATTINSANGFQAQSVGAINGVWVVGGIENTGQAAIQYSVDGTTWTTVPVGYLGGYGILTLATGNGLIMGMSNFAQHILSSDGINWTVYNHYPPVGGDQSLAFGNGYFIFRAFDDLAYSADGINWFGTTSVGSGNYMNRGLAYGNGLYVGVGSSGFCYTPNVATPLTLVPYANFSAQNIACGNGVFVSTEAGLGATSNIYISNDGMNWTTIPAGLPISTTGAQLWWNSLVFSQGRFLISKNDTNELAVSSDGINWTLTTGDSLFDAPSNVGAFYMATDNDGLYTAVRPFDGLAQTGVCPCAVPGDYWVKLSGVTLSGVTIGT